MKNLLFCFVFLTSNLGLFGAAKPNIILIFADDLGWNETGYQGSDYHETPNIDRLAKEGMVFTNAYAGAGNCQPSRACLMSGQNMPRHGVYAVNSTNRGAVEEMRLIPVPNTQGLTKENLTMADALKTAGYATGIFGKWHLDEKPGGPPDERGFDTAFGTGKDFKHGGKDDPKGIFSLTKAAGEFIEKNKERPFFVYLPHYAIHAAHQSLPATLEHFKEKEKGTLHRNEKLAACLRDLDDGIGILLKKLTDLGLAENTLIIFTSDNGGINGSSQEPLRGNKGSYYEGGIREPFIARWPGTISPGSRSDVPIKNQDLFPTFLSVADSPVPEGKILDGENLLPLFKNEGALKRESLFWLFPGYLDQPVERGREVDVKGGFRTRPVSIIRKGDWKLHLFFEEWLLYGGREKLATNNAVELYNLKEDIGEHTDLANTNPEKRDELLNELLAWQKEIKATIPSEKNPKYAPGKGTKAKRKGARKK